MFAIILIMLFADITLQLELIMWGTREREPQGK